MRVITTQQMEQLEQLANQQYAIKQNMLMENAGAGIACWTEKFCNQRGLAPVILIVAGRGNNGGDAFVAGRLLAQAGFDINIILLGKESDLNGTARNHYRKLKGKKKISIFKLTKPKDLETEKIKNLFVNQSLILDGLLGTGIKGEVKGFLKNVIEYINNQKKKVIAIDIPSGMDGNTGAGYCVKAYATLTMGLPKSGLLKPGNETNVGYLQVIDIGFPQEILNTIKSTLEYLQPQDFLGLVPERPLAQHKGNNGHVLVLAGSPHYTGAATLCTLGALHSGAGLVTLGIPQSLHSVYQLKLTEAITLPLPDTEEGTLSEDAYSSIYPLLDKIDSIALGPGLTTHPDTIRLVKQIISGCPKPIVIDADGINAVADEPVVLRKAKAPLILTPHLGEMARLLHTSIKGLDRDKWKITRGLADKYGFTLVLKGYQSIITGKDKKIYINSTGNPAISSSGMGDILTGMIASFIAQGFNPLEAAKIGVYLHGLAGDMASQDKSRWNIIASDLLEKLPLAMDSLYGH